MDFNDSYPLFSEVGNLDHLLGHTFWHTLEVIYPLGLIVILLLFGKLSYDMGTMMMMKQQNNVGKTSQTPSSTTNKFNNLKVIAPLILLLILLVLIDLDDILKVLGISSALRVSSQSVFYWLPVELLIFPLGSLFVYMLFGKMCYEKGMSEQVR